MCKITKINTRQKKTGRKYNWLTEVGRQTRILHEISPTKLNIHMYMVA
jgi:hypothetical protein